MHPEDPDSDIYTFSYKGNDQFQGLRETEGHPPEELTREQVQNRINGLQRIELVDVYTGYDEDADSC